MIRWTQEAIDMLKTIHKNIKSRRKELKMTQSDLAEKLGYADKSMIAKIEAGLVDLPQSRIEAFAAALGTTKEALTGWTEPARRYSNSEDHRAAGLCRPQNCRIKQKSPGRCRGSLSLSCICWQRRHATPRIFLVLFRTSAGSRPEPFTLPAISCASTSAGSGSAGFAVAPWMVQ